MKVKRLDRVAIMVRDIDAAVEFFSDHFGMKFKELTKSISEREGVRCFVCHDTGIELFSPIIPLPEKAPPPVRKRVETLKENEMQLVGLVFEVDDPGKMAHELEDQGIRIQHEYRPSHDYVSIGMDNFAQIEADERDTLGMMMAFGRYDPVSSESDNP